MRDETLILAIHKLYSFKKLCNIFLGMKVLSPGGSVGKTYKKKNLKQNGIG